MTEIHDIDSHGYVHLYDHPDYINLRFERSFSTNTVVTYRTTITNEYGCEQLFKRYFRNNSGVKKFLEKEFINKNKYSSHELNLWRRFGSMEPVSSWDLGKDNSAILKKIFNEEDFLDRIAATGTGDD